MVVSQGSDGPEGIGGSHAAGLRPPGSATETAAGAKRLVGAGLALPPEACLTIPGLLLDVVARRQGQVALRAKKLGIYQNVSWVDLRGISDLPRPRKLSERHRCIIGTVTELLMHLGPVSWCHQLRSLSHQLTR